MRSDYLRSVGVGSRVRHGKHERLVVLRDKFLVLKLLTIDGLAASAVAAGEVTTLHTAEASGFDADHEGRTSTLQNTQTFNAPGA